MIHRAKFLDELVKNIPPECVTFGARVKSLSQEPSENAVLLHFSDGYTPPARHAIAVGCDGIKSDMRKSLFGPSYSAKFSGKYAYRGLLPMEKAISLLGNEHQARTAQIYVGPYGHVLTASVEKGSIMNVVAFRTEKSNVWPHGDKWVVPMNREDMEKDYQGWGKDVSTILGLMEKPDTWALFEDPPLPKYWVGRVAVMGDAAHGELVFSLSLSLKVFFCQNL
jgi:salicylate hydroxylase